MRLIASLASAIFFGTAGWTTAAGVAQVINYRGKLADVNGNPLTGTYSFRFNLCASQSNCSGGNLLFNEDWTGASNAVAVANGVYTVQIGSLTTGGIPFAVFDSSSVFLEISVQAGTSLSAPETLSPRERLAGAAFAVHSLTSEKLGTGANVATFTAAGLMVFPGSVNATTMTLTGTAFSVGATGLVLTGGNLGIGTGTPVSSLDVNGGATVRSSATWVATSAPPVSVAGRGAIYFDSTANSLEISQNGGAYAPIGGLVSEQVFTSGGTWNRPTGVTLIRIRVVGGGGGGGGANASNGGGGGGGGGYCESVISVTGTASAAVTVGAGGSAGAANSTGGTGGTSSFGAFSATGGTGGISGGAASGRGPGGIGSGCDINSQGSDGDSSGTLAAAGGDSALGGRADADASGTAAAGHAFGGGGSGGGGPNVAGAAGGAGVVIVENYR